LGAFRNHGARSALGPVGTLSGKDVRGADGVTAAFCTGCGGLIAANSAMLRAGEALGFSIVCG
jgi:hypothetical protein